ncbi:hypothetical protein Tco_0702259 [Tanacetum coccineum]|uniref:Uncharacterized protein n=1 Tax=Tanacetum coccineum TaxID=301880 RepID=A0ABQ4XVE9_9ASTR
MVDGQENIVDDSSIPKNDEPNILGTRIEPRSNKESPKVEITKDKEVEITKETPMVEITNVVIPVNVNDDDDEIIDEARFMPRKSSIHLSDNLHDVMVETLPIMVDNILMEQLLKQVPEQVRNPRSVFVCGRVDSGEAS